MVSKARLVNFSALSLQDVSICSLSCSKIFLVYCAVFIENFSKLENHDCAPRAFHRELAPASNVLSHIIHVDTELGISYFYWINCLDDLNGLEHLSFHHSSRTFDALRTCPLVGRLLIGRSIPSRFFQTRIIHFPVINTIFGDGTTGYRPTFITDNIPCSPIGKFDIHLKNHLGRTIPSIPKDNS